jgi:hypothetical protein
MNEAQSIYDYVTSGKSKFELTVPSRDMTYRYRVLYPQKTMPGTDGHERLFVSMFTEEKNYKYIGHMFIPNRCFYVHGSKSRVSPEDPGAKLFKWFWSWIRQNEMPRDLVIEPVKDTYND